MDFQDVDKQIPTIIDIIASQYHYTIEYIQNLDLGEIQLLLKQIKNRLEKERGITTSNMEEAIGNDEEKAINKLKHLGIAK